MFWISIVSIVIAGCLIWLILSVVDIMSARFPSKLPLRDALLIILNRILDVLRLRSECPRCRHKVYLRRGNRLARISGIIRGKSIFMCPECRISWRRSGWIRPYRKE